MAVTKQILACFICLIIWTSLSNIQASEVSLGQPIPQSPVARQGVEMLTGGQAVTATASPEKAESKNTLKCYECDSKVQSECLDPTGSNKLLIDCSNIPGISDRCVKISSFKGSVKRGCGGVATDSDLVRAEDGCKTEDHIRTCLCSTDGCNSANLVLQGYSLYLFVFLKFFT
ncbi:hypothetical protein RvY_16882 [Ramazzottius varieornatus]|uniref:Protein sleepless n=1 Tax=Ramazzottius varieornatus TaxID=947166 RepID=A0A1D1W025_RAMVA|nr:hypothetical protein RvY_16882 [Ramazzottius varieornatus]